MKLIDTNGSGEHLVRTYRHGDRTVRVEVRHDFYERNSCARASVLSDTYDWTPLADEPIRNWHGALQPRVPLAEVADRLAGRAAAILR